MKNAWTKKIERLKEENNRLWTYIKSLPVIRYKINNKYAIEEELRDCLKNFKLIYGVRVTQEINKFEYAEMLESDMYRLIEEIMEILINNAIKESKE